jgi:hypothetical protein
MDDKQTILTLLSPKAVLKAMTPEAERSVPDGRMEVGFIVIRHFPFMVGRESRGAIVDGKFLRSERPRVNGRNPLNDLYLIDAVEPLEISRSHFQIESTAEGYLLIDRGSACGTTVGGIHIGGDDAGGSAPLKDGDTVGIGTESTPYLFTFISLLGPASDGR